MQQVYRRRYETKAAARQSRIHIKEQKIKCGEKRFSKWRMELLHPAMWHLALESPSGSTLQCDRWLWDDMPWNSPKRPPYWNSTSGFDFDHITAVDMSFCTSLQNVIQMRTTLNRRNYVMSIFKMADLSHLRFYGSNNGSFEKPMYGFL